MNAIIVAIGALILLGVMIVIAEVRKQKKLHHTQ